MRATNHIVFALLVLASILLAQNPLDQGIGEFQKGQYAAARRHLQSAVQTNPTDTRARVFLALARAGAGECAAVLPDLFKEYATGTDAPLKRLAGLALASCLDSQLKSEYPADADVLYQSARHHMREWNDTLAQMFEKTPASYRVNQISGEVFETQGRFAEAASEYRKAITKNPRVLDLHYRLGRALLLTDKSPATLAEARREFQAEIALNAGDAAAEYQVGQILIAEGNRDASLPHFERALAIRPDFTEALIAVGKARLEAKQFPAAIQLLESAVRQQPRSEAAHYNLMLAYRNAGQMEKARAQKLELDKVRKPPSGEFTEFLKKLGEKGPQP
jgi:tetratricopeptide (TPR) repeat protein